MFTLSGSSSRSMDETILISAAQVNDDINIFNI